MPGERDEIDLDQPDGTDPGARVPVAPGVVISSGTAGHRHLYWPLIQPLSVSQVERANASGLTPVAFVHGLWLLPSSWDRWATLFENAGYVAVKAGWPDDPETVAEAREHPEVFAGKGISEIADYEAAIIRRQGVPFVPKSRAIPARAQAITLSAIDQRQGN